MSFWTKVRNPITKTARVMAAPLTGGASLAQSRADLITVAKVDALALGGAAYPGAAAVVGKTALGVVAATAIAQASNPPPRPSQEVAPVQYVPAGILSPPSDSINPTIAPSAGLPAVSTLPARLPGDPFTPTRDTVNPTIAPGGGAEPAKGKGWLGLALAALPVLALFKG